MGDPKTQEKDGTKKPEEQKKQGGCGSCGCGH